MRRSDFLGLIGTMQASDYLLIEFYEDNHLELYKLKEDISETANLAETLPYKVRQFHQLLQAWRTRIGAQMPTLLDNDPTMDKARRAKKGLQGATLDEDDWLPCDPSLFLN